MQADPPPSGPLPLPPLDLPDYAGPSVRALAAEHGPAFRWILIVTLVCGAIGTMLAATIVNVALPAIIGVYGLGQDQAQWLSTAFLTSSTAFMLLNTWAVQSFGVRTSFLAAMAVFSTGSILGATSQAYELLIAGRILQGAGAGLIQPMAMLLIFQVFPERTRGTAIGLYALGVILSPAFGPVVGGALIDLFSWRIVFIATLPIVAIAVACALVFLPVRESAGPRPTLDWQGLVLVILALCLTLNGLAHGHREGWSDTGAILRLAGALAAALAFVAWEQGRPFPILNLALFASRGFRLAGLVLFATGLAIYGSTYLIPLFTQLIQHHSPTGAGLILFPAGLAMIIVFPISGRLGDHVDVRWLLAAGLALFGASMLLLASISAATSFAAMAAFVVVSRIGIAVTMPAANASAMRQVDPVMLIWAAPAATFLTQTGGALGVATLAVLLPERAAFHIDTLTCELTSETIEALHLLGATLAQSGLTASDGASQAQQLLASVLWADAQTLAFRDCFFLIACAFAALMLAIPALPRGREPHRLPRSAPAPKPAETPAPDGLSRLIRAISPIRPTRL